jgi:hypothetical protein
LVGGHLGDIRVLAEEAPEITSYGCNGIGAGPGKKVEQGFLFNGISVSGDNPVVDEADKPPSTVFPDPADTLLAVFDQATMIAEKATDAVAVLFFIEICLFHCCLLLATK